MCFAFQTLNGHANLGGRKGMKLQSEFLNRDTTGNHCLLGVRKVNLMDLERFPLQVNAGSPR